MTAGMSNSIKSAIITLLRFFFTRTGAAGAGGFDAASGADVSDVPLSCGGVSDGSGRSAIWAPVYYRVGKRSTFTCTAQARELAFKFTPRKHRPIVTRRQTATAVVGAVPIGSAHPIVVQSMTNTDTA